jgi:hypothetical protein
VLDYFGVAASDDIVGRPIDEVAWDGSKGPKLAAMSRIDTRVSASEIIYIPILLFMAFTGAALPRRRD